MERSNYDPDAENQNQTENQLSFAAKTAVENVVASMLEDARYKLVDEKTASFEACRAAISDAYVDETAIIDLSMEEEIGLIEQFADEFGFVIGDVTPNNLRDRIDGIAIWIVRYLAERQVMEAIQALEEFMEAHELEFSHIVSDNNHGRARHYAERGEGAHGFTNAGTWKGKKSTLMSGNTTTKAWKSLLRNMLTPQT